MFIYRCRLNTVVYSDYHSILSEQWAKGVTLPWCVSIDPFLVRIVQANVLCYEGFFLAKGYMDTTRVDWIL